jgi:hypothetical protein
LRTIHAALAGYYSELNSASTEEKRRELAKRIRKDLVKQRNDLETLLEATLPK